MSCLTRVFCGAVSSIGQFFRSVGRCFGIRNVSNTRNTPATNSPSTAPQNENIKDSAESINENLPPTRISESIGSGYKGKYTNQRAPKRSDPSVTSNVLETPTPTISVTDIPSSLKASSFRQKNSTLHDHLPTPPKTVHFQTSNELTNQRKNKATSSCFSINTNELRLAIQRAESESGLSPLDWKRCIDKVLSAVCVLAPKRLPDPNKPHYEFITIALGISISKTWSDRSKDLSPLRSALMLIEKHFDLIQESSVGFVKETQFNENNDASYKELKLKLKLKLAEIDTPSSSEMPSTSEASARLAKKNSIDNYKFSMDLLKKAIARARCELSSEAWKNCFMNISTALLELAPNDLPDPRDEFCIEKTIKLGLQISQIWPYILEEEEEALEKIDLSSLIVPLRQAMRLIEKYYDDDQDISLAGDEETKINTKNNSKEKTKIHAKAKKNATLNRYRKNKIEGITDSLVMSAYLDVDPDSDVDPLCVNLPMDSYNLR